MFRIAVLLAVLCAASGCAGTAPLRPSLSEGELLSGGAFFGSPIPPPSVAEHDALALDEEMRAFVAEQTRGIRSAETRLRRLLSGMQERGLFSLDYTPDITRTARETFHQRQGNCLSFTMLFVALAREAGLDVSYQMVDVPPVWSSGSDVVILSSHINVLVETLPGRSFVVDFNTTDFRGNYDRRVVSDRYAMALFYGNLGAEAFLERDYEASFGFFRAAIETYPDVAGPWVNLGLLYARLGAYQHAEASYRHALSADRHNRSAMTNLANLYAITGKEELAEHYHRRVRHYQERNPYYHYSLARRAYEEQRADDALKFLRTALRLKRDEHQFHYLRALVYDDLGQRQNARQSLVQARDHAPFPDIRATYTSKLEVLVQN
jgi:tetratricopeptide (TPR) repeat protein